MKEIRPIPSVHGSVKIPGSKSLTHRALIAASLANGISRISNALICEDTLYTIRALQELGARISTAEEDTRVSGTGGNFPPSSGRKEIFLGNSGTSYRLLLSTVALARGEYLLTGSSRMKERPIGNLVRALNGLGVEAVCVEQDGFPPVMILAKGMRGGQVKIDGGNSSQYISSLLLAGPYADRDVEMEIRGDLVSKPYIDLTLEVMEKFGASIAREGYRYFKIPAGRPYRSSQLTISGDVSSASYFWAAAAVTGGTMATEGIDPFFTRQGDIGLLDIMEGMGCFIQKKPDKVIVRGGELAGIEVDMHSLPDMVPTVAAMALFAKGKTIIRNVSHLRHKESDRLAAVASEWKRLGSRIVELHDGLVIHGCEKLEGTLADPHNDHRIAMSLAVVGLRVPGLVIKNESCVSKSFPRFWDLWESLGSGKKGDETMPKSNL